jgi:predicted Zn-dependent protease
MLQALERVAAVEGQQSMERGGAASIFSTHPVTSERVQRVARQAAQTGRTGAINREAYLSAIDGMTFGDAPEQGLISGPSFRHASLRLGFDAPPGFTLQNSPQAVAGRGRDGSQFVFQGVQVPAGQRLDSVAEQVWRQMTNNRVPPVRGGFREVNSIDAFTSEARLASARGQVDVGVHVFRTDPNSVWLIRTIAPAGRGPQFESLLQSFRRLSPAEIERARAGRRLDVVTVRAGDTPASLAQRMSPPYNRVQSFLALNGLPDRPLQPGERVKLIVG